MTTNKRLDAIKLWYGTKPEKRFDTGLPFRDPFSDVAYLLSLVEKQREALKLIMMESTHNGHSFANAPCPTCVVCIVKQALKCDEGGEVGE